MKNNTEIMNFIAAERTGQLMDTDGECNGMNGFMSYQYFKGIFTLYACIYLCIFPQRGLEIVRMQRIVCWKLPASAP